MKVLVTGGAGYLGSILVPQLLADGHEVYVLDTFRHGPTLALSATGRLGLWRGDARDPAVLHPLVDWADAVIPLAAVVGAPACDADPMNARQVNYDAIALACELAPADRLVVYPNTNSGYGSQPGVLTEESPFKPISLYARTKTLAEARVLARGGISLRLATLFGVSPRMRFDLLVNDFTRRAVRDRSLVLFGPRARRNFVHVRDAARAFGRALLNPKRGEVYNVGDDAANLTKERLCGAIAEVVRGFTWFVGDGADPDRRDYEVSSEKLRRTGWEPRVTLREGIEEVARSLPMFPSTYGNA